MGWGVREHHHPTLLIWLLVEWFLYRSSAAEIKEAYTSENAQNNIRFDANWLVIAVY